MPDAKEGVRHARCATTAALYAPVGMASSNRPLGDSLTFVLTAWSCGGRPIGCARNVGALVELGDRDLDTQFGDL